MKTNDWLKFGVPVIIGTILLATGLVVFSENSNKAPLTPVEPTQSVELKDNERFLLAAGPIQNEMDNQKINGYAYNNQSPGPLLKVIQGTSIFVDFQNNLPEPTTVHWHGLRLENRFDGVPDVTQSEVLPGQSFEYKLDFSDAGLFWYHPHVREDRQQELGMYGTILVEPKQPLEEMQEEVLVLDDILLENGKLPDFPENANFAIMGRYGSQLLINGKTDYRLSVTTGKPIRLYLLNAANARPFRFAIANTRLKLVGGDAGLLEKPIWIENVTLGPSERAIVEIFFDEPGEFAIQNQTPVQTTSFGTFLVLPERISLDAKQSFDTLSENPVAKEEIEKFKPFFDREPVFEYELLIRWPAMDRMMGGQGMPHGMMGMNEDEDGIEWEDDMMGINQITQTDEVTWIIRDAKTKKENMDFSQIVKKDDIKKIRITNLENSSHPMQHPIHLHGNRFLVLSEDGIPNPNLVWKDTVLIPTGKTVDLLVEFSNPGDWMIHCHIAEHLESSMMSLIKVEP